MDRERHLAALRHEAAALAAAARAAAPDTPVPSCPAWDVMRLVRHTTHAYRWVTRIVSTHADAEVDETEVDLPDGSPEAYEQALAELVETLTNEAPDTRCWNWSGEDLTVAFWCRRMAQETAVHRWDAQLAAGDARPVEPELAADGVDEMLGVFLPVYLAQTPVDGLSGTAALVATDTGDTWHATFHPDRAEVVRNGATDAGATLRGSASDLLLALWGRGVAVETSGDPRLVTMLTEGEGG
ncbi:MAG TPA: maleylpyruvate isomerase family mycothiol-dependent enzyme [Mycobacteriales bacterium]|jgi:uncharacterized protein (TIGR03083 family)|nr:maleylpyruvate isomerase family mycothiol-dependent enzyme [Mycobacteriales bacterium]